MGKSREEERGRRKLLQCLRMAAGFVDSDGLDGCTDIVDTKDVGTFLKGNNVKGSSAIEGFEGRCAKKAINHRLSTDADEEGHA